VMGEPNSPSLRRLHLVPQRASRAREALDIVVAGGQGDGVCLDLSISTKYGGKAFGRVVYLCS
jgi:hypothetical protein